MICIEFADIFHEKILQHRGVNPLPQIQLTVSRFLLTLSPLRGQTLLSVRNAVWRRSLSHLYISLFWSEHCIQLKLLLQSSMVIYLDLEGKLPKSFDNFFQKSSDVHVKPTRFSRSESLYIPRFKSVTYGLNSITNAAIHSLNKLTEVVDKPSSLSINEVKTIMSNNN